MGIRFTFMITFWLITISVLAQRPQPFEGVITYAVETALKQDSSSVNNHYAKKYGDTLTVYYSKNGSERREYQNTGSYGLEFVIYNKISNEEYTKWKDLDYVVYSSSADTVTRLDTLFVGDPNVILGDTCQSICIKTTDLKNGGSVRETLYYSGNEHIMPPAYLKRKARHLDKIYHKSQSLFLRRDLTINYANYSFTAISIERALVDPNLFIIPKGLTKNKKM